MASKLKFKINFQRVGTIRTVKGEVRIGDITEFQQNPDGTIEVTIEFDPKCPGKIQEEIEKNPMVLGIQSKMSSISEKIIIPGIQI